MGHAVRIRDSAHKLLKPNRPFKSENGWLVSDPSFSLLQSKPDFAPVRAAGFDLLIGRLAGPVDTSESDAARLESNANG